MGRGQPNSIRKVILLFIYSLFVSESTSHRSPDLNLDTRNYQRKPPLFQGHHPKRFRWELVVRACGPNTTGARMEPLAPNPAQSAPLRVPCRHHSPPAESAVPGALGRCQRASPATDAPPRAQRPTSGAPHAAPSRAHSPPPAPPVEPGGLY